MRGGPGPDHDAPAMGQMSHGPWVMVCGAPCRCVTTFAVRPQSNHSPISQPQYDQESHGSDPTMHLSEIPNFIENIDSIQGSGFSPPSQAGGPRLRVGNFLARSLGLVHGLESCSLPCAFSETVSDVLHSFT